MRVNRTQVAEQKENRLLPVGDYYFEVLSAAEGKSRNGDDMFTLKLAVFDGEGKKKAVKDWIGGWNWDKVQGFYESVGDADTYASGDLDANEMVGKAGMCHIKHSKDMKGDPCMQVGWFIPLRDGQAVPSRPERVEVAQSVATVVDEDELPF